ncbi:thioesterase domain-containing protein [Streptomyces sp. NPDC050617]|uniref:thioesterase II family protein n=1 Tax=Streptomyces sp. NPDC050617 TaxID=3154628 RepID=UPI00343E1794
MTAHSRPASAPADGHRWFRRHARADAARLRLVCFPHAGGAASLFRDWQGGLPLDVEVLAARYPGRQDRFREPCITSMPQLCDRIVQALQPFLDTPLALFGHSLGAKVAHEVTARLELRHGVGPVRLFVSGTGPAHLATATAPAALDDARLMAHTRRLGAANAHLLDDPELAALLLPSLRGDYELAAGYRPTRAQLTRVRAPITAFTGDRDPLTPLADVLAWAELTRGGFDHLVFPGGHFYLEPWRAAVLDEIAAALPLPYVPLQPTQTDQAATASPSGGRAESRAEGRAEDCARDCSRSDSCTSG